MPAIFLAVKKKNWYCRIPTFKLKFISKIALILWIKNTFKIRIVHCCSVTKSGLTFCSPMDCSMPGFPVLHCLLEFAQTHVHWVGDAIQPSCSLSSPSPPAFNLSQHQGLFLMSWLFASGGQSIGASLSASVLAMNIQGWFLLELTGLISLQS